MLQVYVSNISVVSLQVFQMHVAKVDWDVAYVAMVVHVCYKGLLPMFHLCFRTHVASVFIWMLHHCMCFIWVLLMFVKVFKCFWMYF
jgi:hypothetical protein